MGWRSHATLQFGDRPDAVEMGAEPMNCPGCAATMPQHTLAAHMGGSVTIDLCLACRAFWFDGYESLQLTPASTLRLFGIVSDAAAPAQAGASAVGVETRYASSDRARCPRCSLPLHPVEDMQRATRFRYRKCPRGHGRFIGFFDFLREKNFVKPMSGEEIAELRAHVVTVHCSSCGAPIDLAHASTCGHCGSALSMLDLRHARALIEQLRVSDAEDRSQAGRGSDTMSPLDPALELDLLRARRQAERVFDEANFGVSWYSEAASAGTIGASLRALSRWLAGVRGE
jgi:Zn-finger nucleic acid-binding protein